MLQLEASKELVQTHRFTVDTREQACAALCPSLLADFRSPLSVRCDAASSRSTVPHRQRLCETSADQPSTDASVSASSQLFRPRPPPAGESKCIADPWGAEKRQQGAGAFIGGRQPLRWQAPAWTLSRLYRYTASALYRDLCSKKRDV